MTSCGPEPPRLGAGAQAPPAARAELIDRAIAALDRVAAAGDRPVARTTGDQQDLESALRRAIDDGLDRLRRPAPGDEPPGDVAQLVAELQDVYLQLRELRVQRRIAAHDRAQDGLERWRNAGSPAQLLERVTREICRSGGFERAVLSKVEGSTWVLAGAHFEEHPDWAADFVEFGSRARPTLTHTLLEARMTRRPAPVLVADAANDPRTHKPFVKHARARCYVVAPIMPRGRVIGFIHADHHFSGRPVDAVDREALRALATGFAYAYERVVLLERLREQRNRIRELTASTAELVSDLCHGDAGFDDPGSDRAMVRGWAAPAGGGESDAPRLTPREVEILALMAAGATNAAIARELFISEGTVKSHVARMLRKLDASNRAEAVSRYLRLRIAQRDARPPAAPA